MEQPPRPITSSATSGTLLPEREMAGFGMVDCGFGWSASWMSCEWRIDEKIDRSSMVLGSKSSLQLLTRTCRLFRSAAKKLHTHSLQTYPPGQIIVRRTPLGTAASRFPPRLSTITIQPAPC